MGSGRHDCAPLRPAGDTGATPQRTYAVADFARTPKFDSHVHANTDDDAFLDIAAKDGFELLSINVDYPDFPSMAAAGDMAHRLPPPDRERFSLRHHLLA